jgi:nucleotide-binding universal stress UspA family protein
VPPPPSKIPGWAKPRLTPQERDHYLQELTSFAAPALGAGVQAKIDLVEGDPIQEILKAAGEGPADLITLGTHGRGGFQRMVLGSITEKVLRRAACPVLTAPPRAAGPQGQAPPVFRHILCPVDFSDASIKSLEYGFSLAKEAKASITLIHAVEALAEVEPLEHASGTMTEWLRFLEERARQRLGQLIPAGARDWCTPEIVVATGRAWREVLRAAEQRASDLIVMGVQGRGAIDLMLFGSTTAHVVRQAICPVLTVRSK